MVMWVIVTLAFGASVLIEYSVSKYLSAKYPDTVHSDALRMDGDVIYVSSASHFAVSGSFAAVLIAVFALVGLGVYYRWAGVAPPPLRQEKMTRLNLK